MKHEGDCSYARLRYYQDSSNNLKFLLKNRFEWMNEYIGEEDKGIEVGCGNGLGKEFIRCKNYLLTDYADYEWLDVKNVDALNTPFKDEEFDFVISNNMTHHLPYPLKFLSEMNRILKSGGYLLIQDVNCSLLLRVLLRLMHHEGYSFDSDVFDENAICTELDDLWSANNAIPNLLFEDIDFFQKKVPHFKVLKTGCSECFIFLNSGGVIAKVFYIPLSYAILEFLAWLDNVLSKVFPQIFTLQMQVVLQKV